MKKLTVFMAALALLVIVAVAVEEEEDSSSELDKAIPLNADRQVAASCPYSTTVYVRCKNITDGVCYGDMFEDKYGVEHTPEEGYEPCPLTSCLGLYCDASYSAATLKLVQSYGVSSKGLNVYLYTDTPSMPHCYCTPSINEDGSYIGTTALRAREGSPNYLQSAPECAGYSCVDGESPYLNYTRGVCYCCQYANIPYYPDGRTRPCTVAGGANPTAPPSSGSSDASGSGTPSPGASSSSSSSGGRPPVVTTETPWDFVYYVRQLCKNFDYLTDNELRSAQDSFQCTLVNGGKAHVYTGAELTTMPAGRASCDLLHNDTWLECCSRIGSGGIPTYLGPTCRNVDLAATPMSRRVVVTSLLFALVTIMAV